MMISLTNVQYARNIIEPFIHKTPLIHSNSLSMLSGAEVYLKLENLQKTGSFKCGGYTSYFTGGPGHCGFKGIMHRQWPAAQKPKKRRS
jgi:threonine dehydratase